MRISTPLAAASFTGLFLAAGQASASPLLALPHAALARFAATAAPLMIPEPASAAFRPSPPAGAGGPASRRRRYRLEQEAGDATDLSKKQATLSPSFRSTDGLIFVTPHGLVSAA
jgi:hypothetical protein